MPGEGDEGTLKPIKIASRLASVTSSLRAVSGAPAPGEFNLAMSSAGAADTSDLKEAALRSMGVVCS